MTQFKNISALEYVKLAEKGFPSVPVIFTLTEKELITYGIRCIPPFALTTTDDIAFPVDGRPDLILPGNRHADTIVSFWRLHKEAPLILCVCGAGVSRSTAVAAALTRLSGGDDMPFFREYCPNRLLYNLILEAGGIGFVNDRLPFIDPSTLSDPIF